ncbi:hypothetical protein P4604_14930 [Lysinibacillus capsici]|uniref:hypothetical protein n=1 Tax=Lysinibacillus capsici TaxID=2115968 RepID=UPI002E1BCCAF|nr:hypothetical protein [Lysinibacillus capsici]
MDYNFQIVYTKDNYMPVLSESIENSVWDYLKRNNVEVEKLSSQQETSSNLNDSIKNESIIIGHLLTKNLTYNSLFTNNKINNAKHFVNLIGIDDIRGVYISDGHIPSYPVRIFEGWTKLDDDDVSNYFYRINRNQLMNLPYLTEKKNPTMTIYREKLFKILRSFLEGGSSNGNYYGFSAYEKCILDLTTIQDHCIQSHQELFYRRAFNLTSGGLVTLKRLIKLFLTKLSLDKYATDMEKIIRKFELLKLLLLKCSITFQKDDVLDIKKKLSEILQIEVNLYRSILKDEHN